MSLIQRFTKRLKRDGLLATCSYCMGRFASVFRSLLPSERRNRRAQEAKEKQFQKLREAVDASFDQIGVDTSGKIELANLSVSSDNKDDGCHYQAVFPERLRQALAVLNVDFRDYTFIDFGSGKGRAVLIASEFPFEKIIGVEFARELHETAQRNWLLYRSNTQACCQAAEWHCMDAAEFLLPADPLVIYLYNPFGESVMKRLVSNVLQSVAEAPRPIFVVYLNPVWGKVWEGTGIEVIWENDYGKVYRIHVPTSYSCNH